MNFIQIIILCTLLALGRPKVQNNEVYSSGGGGDDTQISKTQFLAFSNIIFEGGGVKSLSFIGALKALKMSSYYDNGRFTFDRYAGSSTGCLFAFMAAIQIDPDDMEALAYTHKLFDDLLPINNQTFDNIKMPSNLSWYKNLFDVYNLMFNVIALVEDWTISGLPGLTGNDKLIKFFINTLIPLSPIKDKLHGNMTFQDLYEINGKTLNCIATSVTREHPQLLGKEATPDLRVIDVVYASMATPILFKPLMIDTTMFMDGSLSNNFPLELWDTGSGTSINSKTLGLSLRHKDGGLMGSLDGSVLASGDVVNTEYYFDLLYNFMTCHKTHKQHSDDRVIWLDSPLSNFKTNVSPELIGLTINRAYLNTISSPLIKKNYTPTQNVATTSRVITPDQKYDDEAQAQADDHDNDDDVELYDPSVFNLYTTSVNKPLK